MEALLPLLLLVSYLRKIKPLSTFRTNLFSIYN